MLKKTIERGEQLTTNTHRALYRDTISLVLSFSFFLSNFHYTHLFSQSVAGNQSIAMFLWIHITHNFSFFLAFCSCSFLSNVRRRAMNKAYNTTTKTAATTTILFVSLPWINNELEVPTVIGSEKGNVNESRRERRDILWAQQ